MTPRAVEQVSQQLFLLFLLSIADLPLARSQPGTLAARVTVEGPTKGQERAYHELADTLPPFDRSSVFLTASHSHDDPAVVLPSFPARKVAAASSRYVFSSAAFAGDSTDSVCSMESFEEMEDMEGKARWVGALRSPASVVTPASPAPAPTAASRSPLFASSPAAIPAPATSKPASTLSRANAFAVRCRLGRRKRDSGLDFDVPSIETVYPTTSWSPSAASSSA